VNSVAELSASLQELQRRIVDHPIYSAVNNEVALRSFMETHVFAVWDFMSLLKFLQRRLTSVEISWLPIGSTEARRLINEIVLAEESDEDGEGGFCSHFELYLRAMRDCGADVSRLENFLRRLENGTSVAQASNEAPPVARQFLATTWEILCSESLPAVAAAFSLGREDIVPKMFHRLVENLHDGAPERWARFLYYLERHVHLDDKVHGPMAARLLESACGGNALSWKKAEWAARLALQARIVFWDALHAQLTDGSA